MKSIIALTCLFAVATCSNLSITKSSIKGVVDPVRRCGGVGTQGELRISDCQGRCTLVPGTVYACENDFAPSSASPSLSLRVEICMSTGLCTNLFDVELENSSVQPGFYYSVKYDIVPNDVLSGQTVEFRAYITHTDSRLLEICVAADIDITELVVPSTTPAVTTSNTVTTTTTTETVITDEPSTTELVSEPPTTSTERPTTEDDVTTTEDLPTLEPEPTTSASP